MTVDMSAAGRRQRRAHTVRLRCWPSYDGQPHSKRQQVFGLDFSQIGPPMGERFPDLRLPDQYGRLVDLHADRGIRRALVMFHRSADW